MLVAMVDYGNGRDLVLSVKHKCDSLRMVEWIVLMHNPVSGSKCRNGSVRAGTWMIGQAMTYTELSGRPGVPLALPATPNQSTCNGSAFDRTFSRKS